MAGRRVERELSEYLMMRDLGTRYGWIVAVLVVVGGKLPAAEHAIVVTARGRIENAPLTVALPASLVGKPVHLSDDGRPVPAQADQLGGKPALTWLVDRLEAGKSKRYKLSEGAPEPLSPEQGVQLAETEAGLDILIDGKPFTTYLVAAGPKPYCWPMYGPGGHPITRAYPMRSDVPGERHDHPHHRSFFFTFDRVNDHDFWSELERAGKTVHAEFLKITSGPVFGEFVAKVDWIGKEGKCICRDVRRMRVYRVPGARLFDFEIAVEASEGPLVFGDSKEGLFAFRVAESMKVDQGKDKKGGTLLNANGERDAATWGKRAAWCDYYGPVADAIEGIAIFDHPANFRHPTYWHSRTYGLFAANPFGIRHFTGDKNQDGSHRVEKGDKLRLVYRVYLHSGDTQSAKVAEHYQAFAQPPVVSVK